MSNSNRWSAPRRQGRAEFAWGFDGTADIRPSSLGHHLIHFADGANGPQKYLERQRMSAAVPGQPAQFHYRLVRFPKLQPEFRAPDPQRVLERKLVKRGGGFLELPLPEGRSLKPDNARLAGVRRQSQTRPQRFSPAQREQPGGASGSRIPTVFARTCQWE